MDRNTVLTALIEEASLESQKRAALRQRKLYSWQPWRPGIPTRDALGNLICFKDASAHSDSRYWIPFAREDGAHIRVFSSGTMFQVKAAIEADAREIGNEYAALKNLECLTVSMRTSIDGYAIAEFRTLKRSLD